jgi:hypothetical protein
MNGDSMERNKMRRIVEYARDSGLASPGNREALEEALSGCANRVTRAKLRAKILRGERQTA